MEKLFKKVSVKEFLLYGIYRVKLAGPIGHPGYLFQYHGVVESVLDLLPPAKWAMSMHKDAGDPHRVQSH